MLKSARMCVRSLNALQREFRFRKLLNRDQTQMCFELSASLGIDLSFLNQMLSSMDDPPLSFPCLIFRYLGARCGNTVYLLRMG